MIKSILVCTDGSDFGNVACDYAIDLTKRLEARLLGLHVLDSRMLEGPLMADISGWVGAQPYGTQLKQFRELMEQKGEAVIGALNDRCTKAGVKIEAWMKMGHPARVIIEEEGRAELVIMGQKGEHADLIGDMMGSNVERIVRQSANPCLVTPDTFKPVSKVLAAYDGSGHASQALQEASELANSLKSDLVLVTAVEGMQADRAKEISADGISIAKDHGCTAEPVISEGRAEDIILKTAEQKGCNLIVVGAYGHTRIREMILGSTTNYLINNSHLPVMLVR